MTSDEMAATLASTGKLAVYGIHFATDSATITPESRPALEQVGRLLTGDPGLELVVEGHTDSTGEEAINEGWKTTWAWRPRGRASTGRARHPYPGVQSTIDRNRAGRPHGPPQPRIEEGRNGS
jgi:hypothetical protein